MIKKVLSLLAAFFVITLPLVAMDGPEGPEQWKNIALRDLRIEVRCIEANRVAKIAFLEEQEKRCVLVWDIIQDLACKFPNNIVISSEDLEINGHRIISNKEDYTAHGIDWLFKQINQARESLEKDNTDEK